MSAAGPQYTEYSIARALMREKFQGAMMLIDNCYWPGNECDLLVVHPTLKLIDVEIKISRADLRKDREKDKWFTLSGWRQVESHGRIRSERARVPTEWPRRIWKHYYVVADPIWQPSLLSYIHPNSGVLKIKIREDGSLGSLVVEKRVRANPNPYTLKSEDLVNLGYLAGVRMLEAYDRERQMRIERANEARRADEILDRGSAIQVSQWEQDHRGFGTGNNDFAHAP